jgi:hypothetical protein
MRTWSHHMSLYMAPSFFLEFQTLTLMKSRACKSSTWCLNSLFLKRVIGGIHRVSTWHVPRLFMVYGIQGTRVGLYSSRVKSSIKCSSSAHLILFRTRVELELIIERNILFKLGSFNFISSTSRARSYHELLN